MRTRTPQVTDRVRRCECCGDGLASCSTNGVYACNECCDHTACDHPDGIDRAFVRDRSVPKYRGREFVAELVRPKDGSSPYDGTGFTIAIGGSNTEPRVTFKGFDSGLSIRTVRADGTATPWVRWR